MQEQQQQQQQQEEEEEQEEKEQHEEEEEEEQQQQQPPIKPSPHYPTNNLITHFFLSRHDSDDESEELDLDNLKKKFRAKAWKTPELVSWCTVSEKNDVFYGEDPEGPLDTFG